MSENGATEQSSSKQEDDKSHAKDSLPEQSSPSSSKGKAELPPQAPSESHQLNPRTSSWKDRGKFDKFRDFEIFYYKQEGDKKSPLLVLLHGYPSSSYDWKQYLELEKERSILAIDLLGFGLSDKPQAHDFSLLWQADLVLEMVHRHNPIPNGPVFIVAHDMSTSVASEIFARDIEGKLEPAINLIGALLFNGNMIIERAKFILGQKLLRTKMGPVFSRFTNSILYRWQLGSVFSREHALSREEGEDQWNLQCYNGGQRILHKLIAYTFQRATYADQWHGAIKNWKKPLSFAWGLEDPVATKNQFEGWKDLRPHANTHEMSGLGHYPQIENAKVFKDVIDDILEKITQQDETTP